MPVQIFRGAVQLRLREARARGAMILSRVAPPHGNQHHHHAPIRQLQKPDVLERAASQRRHHDDSQAARNCRQHVPGALGHLLRRSSPPSSSLRIQFRSSSLSVGPLGHLLREKAVSRRGRHAPGRGVRLIQKARILEVGHDVADGRGAQLLGVRARHRAAGNRLAGLDVRAHHVRQNLLDAAWNSAARLGMGAWPPVVIALHFSCLFGRAASGWSSPRTASSTRNRNPAPRCPPRDGRCRSAWCRRRADESPRRWSAR